MRSRLLILLMMLMPALSLRAQKLATGLDAAWLTAGMLNAGAEMRVGQTMTMSLSVLAASRPWVHRDIAGLALQHELRYYLSGRPMYHHFVGVGALVGGYDMKLDIGHYQGSAVGVGLTFGYVVPLGLRWNLDLHSGFGIVHSEDRHQGNQNYTIPTKVGATLSYIVL